MLKKTFYINSLVSAVLLLAMGSSFAQEATPENLEKLVVSGQAIAQIAPLVEPDVPLGACSSTAQYPHLRITVGDIRSDQGKIRLTLYGDDPEEWLAKGKKALRFDLPAQKDVMIVCMPLPRGNSDYALAVLHDENGNGKTDVVSDGYGFSNGPKVILGAPSYKKVSFTAGAGATDVAIHINYRVEMTPSSSLEPSSPRAD